MLAQYFEGDADKIQQVLTNLLSNAHKFVSRVNGVIRVETSLFDVGDKYLKICVANNGPCIAPELQESLFNPFTRLAEDSYLNPNCHGLGLIICKQICKDLGGDIVVVSKPCAMTKFIFWVKVKQSTGCDIDQLLSHRASLDVREGPTVNTKTGLLFKSFLAMPEQFGALSKNKMLRIVCADSLTNNLEALRLVFT